MDFRKDGWYYRNLNDRAPSWTGVVELGEYLLNNKKNIVRATLIDINQLQIGDIVQIRQGDNFNHSLFVTQIDYPILSLNDIYISCHSTDRLNARLSSFLFKEIKFLKVF